jgi:hypothetical protein
MVQFDLAQGQGECKTRHDKHENVTQDMTRQDKDIHDMTTQAQTYQRKSRADIAI